MIDLTSVVLGPYATQMLGDLGADIIKVEAPEGDTTRYTGPRRHARHGVAVHGHQPQQAQHRARSQAGRGAGRAAAAGRSAPTCSCTTSGRRSSSRSGLGADALLARHPRLIYAGIHGWREDGPYSGRPAYDDIIQGLCGIASLMDQLTGEPRYAPTILCDKTCGLMASQAILAALYHREKTGRGQFIEIPMFETMVSFVMVEHLHGRTFVPEQGELGYSRVLAPWRRPYRTADGYLCMLAYTDAQWRRFWAEVGQPEMMQDPRFVEHGRAQPQHRRGVPAGRRAAYQPHDRGVDRGVRPAGNPGRVRSIRSSR